MSVIAKLLIRGVSEFGMGRLVDLGCVCENDLMAAYATSEEDKLFTRYSPWGEMKISQPEGWILGQPADEFSSPPSFYVMALHESEHELVVDEDARSYAPDKNFPGSAVWAYGVCYSVTDFGGTKQVEFRANNGGTVKGRGIEKLNWKMSVDNPAASDQFKPGERFWIVLFNATKFDRNAAIRVAHGHPEPAPAEAGE